ncbi:MAG: DUF1919 domain-containing protein [Bacteroidota bacterium]
MIRLLKNIYRYFYRRLLKWRFDHSGLTNSDFTILCNNCVAGVIYHDLGMKFLSPTINLYIPYPDYIRFLEDPDQYFAGEMTFSRKSRLFPDEVDYPLGIIGDMEIHFIHYHSSAEAKDKWDERKARFNPDNLLIIGSERDGCTAEDMERFDRLPYSRKVFFSSKKRKDLSSVVYFRKYRNDGQLGDIIEGEEWLNRFDLIGWLNTGKIKRYHLKRWIFTTIFE